MKQTYVTDPLPILTDPELMQRVTNHVMMGGSLIDLADLLQIRYCDLIRWIRYNKETSEAYDQALRDRNEWAKERVLKEIREISFFDIRKILDPEGNVIPVDEWPDEVSKAVVGVEVSEIHGSGDEKGLVIGKLKKIKMLDKLKALEMAAKNLSLLTEKHEVSGKVTLDQLILATQAKKRTHET